MAVRQSPGLDDGWLYRYESLSGGEAKRVQVACALIARPDVLVLDEPSDHVDEPTRAAIAEAMRKFAGIGLLISHDVELIDATCSRCVMFERPQDVRAFIPAKAGLETAMPVRRRRTQKGNPGDKPGLPRETSISVRPSPWRPTSDDIDISPGAGSAAAVTERIYQMWKYS